MAGYSGWRFSSDRSTLERCAGALHIESGKHLNTAEEIENEGITDENRDDYQFAIRDYYVFSGAQLAINALLDERDSIIPTVFVERVRKLAGID